MKNCDLPVFPTMFYLHTLLKKIIHDPYCKIERQILFSEEHSSRNGDLCNESCSEKKFYSTLARESKNLYPCCE